MISNFTANIGATAMTQHTLLLNELRAERQIARRQRPYAHRRSKLERHRRTIIELRDEGATLGEIQHYLRAMAKPAMQVERSTILRFLQQIER